MAKRSVACSVANILLNGTNIERDIKEQPKGDFKKDLKNIRENCHKLRNKSETRETGEKNERSSLRNSLKSMGETGLDVANIGFALAGHPEVSAAAGLAKTAHAHREKIKSNTSPGSDKSSSHKRKVINPMNENTKGGGYKKTKKKKYKKTMKRKTKRKNTKRRKNISRTRKI
jgi:hypothetical protein